MPVPETENTVRKRHGAGHFITGHKAGHIAILVLALLMLYFFWFRGMRFFLVPSSSMESTLYPGDQIATLRDSEYQRGDIVVANDDISSDYVVKRIVAVGGDTVRVDNGALYVNGHYVSEPYVKDPMAYYIIDPVQVPEGTVFLLGDNRNNSEDSHTRLHSKSIGEIVGRVRFIYYPYTRFGPVASYPLSNVPGLSASLGK